MRFDGNERLVENARKKVLIAHNIKLYAYASGPNPFSFQINNQINAYSVQKFMTLMFPFFVNTNVYKIGL